MKALFLIISLSLTVLAFEPVSVYAPSWSMDTSTMTEDTLVKHIVLYSLYPLPEPVSVSQSGLQAQVGGDTMDIYGLAAGLASGSYGSPEMQEAFRHNFKKNLISTFQLLYFYPCAKDNIADRWECVKWAKEIADTFGYPSDQYQPIEDELVGFVADVSMHLIEERP